MSKKMHAKGSNLGRTCLQTSRNSSILVQNLPQRQGSDLGQQYVRSQVGFSTDGNEQDEVTYWRRLIRNEIYEILCSTFHHEQAQELYDNANTIEFKLLKQAASQEEYINQDTLLQRVQTQLNEMYMTKGSQQQVGSSTSYKTVPSGFSNGLFDPSIVHEQVCPPYIAYPGMDELSHVLSCGGRNLATTTDSIGFSFPHQHGEELMMDRHKHGNYWGNAQKNERFSVHTAAMGKSLQSESSNLMNCGQTSGKKTLKRHWLPTRPINVDEQFTSCNNFEVSVELANQSVLRPDKRQKMMSETSLSCNVEHFANPGIEIIKKNVIDVDTFGQTVKNEKIPSFGNIFKNETIPSKGLEGGQISEESELRSHDTVDSRNFMETDTRLNSSMHTPYSSPIGADIENMRGKTGVLDCISEQFENPMHESMPISEKINNVIDDTFGKAFKSETDHSKGLGACHTSEESDPKNHLPADNSNSKETEIGLSSLSDVPTAADVEEISGGVEVNAEQKVSEPKADGKKETKFSKTTANMVSLTDIFTSNQIREHITSLRKHPVQSLPGEETRIDDNTCQLCAMENLCFAPVPIYCACCDMKIGLNKDYYSKRAEVFDAQNCVCTKCYEESRGEHVAINEIFVPKTLLDRKKNDEVLEEGWVQCNKCNRWQHEICALYNRKRDLDFCAEYICPICRLKEIEEGMHVPLPKTAIFCAKDLPSTMLSDHIEKRLFKRLMQEREMVEGTKDLDEVLAAGNLSVKVVLSVDKQLEVKKQFLDIFPKQNYPAEFPYTSKVILLFQQIDGADVCLFAMYVQEFGSECGNPNQRCVYISYLDSVKHFKPERETIRGEALRTLVYHEILIGYLDFCKKRGFTTCYIWSCPPTKGQDYILYCHPDTQKTPRDDKLREWYLSMLRKAAKENIVVSLSNIYDHFFVPTGKKCDSKVTASRLPYFDGDCWSNCAMDEADIIEKETGGEYVVSRRTSKAMGYENPSKDTAKDILVMEKLGNKIMPKKENFIIVHLQHTCVHCQEVIVAGKRWYCTECDKFQECERCHTADSHTSTSGEKHTLYQCQVHVPSDTKENDIILDNQLFENRHSFLSFCGKNQLQFDTLRRAKYSSMMILYHLKYCTVCSICGEYKEFQHSWRCESCPKFFACSACYNKRGAECHAHKLRQASTSLSVSGNEEKSKKKPKLAPTCMQNLQKALQHASQCNSSNKTPCSYPSCLDMKKMISHASRCTTGVAGDCRPCKAARMVLSTHSKICKVSKCRVPCCKELKKRRAAAVLKSKLKTC